MKKRLQISHEKVNETLVSLQ